MYLRGILSLLRYRDNISLLIQPQDSVLLCKTLSIEYSPIVPQSHLHKIILLFPIDDTSFMIVSLPYFRPSSNTIFLIVLFIRELTKFVEVTGNFYYCRFIIRRTFFTEIPLDFFFQIHNCFNNSFFFFKFPSICRITTYLTYSPIIYRCRVDELYP